MVTTGRVFLTLLIVLGVALFLVMVVFVSPPAIAGSVSQLSMFPVPLSVPEMPPNMMLATPDLVIESITFYPFSPAVGESVDITVTVKNIGDASASGFYVYMYIDPIDHPPINTTPYTSRTFWGLPLVPDAEFQWVRTGHIFSDSDAHSVYAWVDRDNDVVELDEENNLYGPIDIPVGVGELLTGSISAVSPYCWNDSWNMVYANILPLSGNPLPSPLTVQAAVSAVTSTLYDDGTHGDFQAGDGYYSNWFLMDGIGVHSVRLLVNGEELASNAIEAINDPNLLILTDIGFLYTEFLDTGTAVSEDLNGDNRVDFYNLLERINTYASAHRGIVTDIAQEITIANGFETDYASLNYGIGTETRHIMGVLIDELIFMQDVQAAGSIQNVALIGDDQVVPFYRVFDPTDYYGYFNTSYPNYQSKERFYPVTVGGTQESATLQDVEQAYILTDVPYSIRSHQIITTETWLPLPPFWATRPTPNMGIGRIFSNRPYELVTMIDRYEEPIHLAPEDANASLFLGQSDIDFSALAERSVLPDLTSFFSGNLMVYDRQATLWEASDFVDNVPDADMVSMWGHATHINFSIAGTSEIDAPDLNTISLDRPLVLAGFGCHLGLSVSDYPDGAGLVYPFSAGMVNPLIGQGVTLFAPSSQAYTWGTNFPSANLHELIHSLFVNRLTDMTCSTVGHVWQEVFPIYHATDPGLVENGNPATHLFHITGAYGNVLYGLPTQPIERTPTSPLRVLQRQRSAASRPSVTSVDPLSITVDIPYFEVSSLEDESTLFSVPSSGMHLAPSHGSVLPLVVRSLTLPDGIAVTDVTLTEFITSTYSQPVTLATASLQTGNGESVEGSYDLPDTYPENLYQYSVITKSNGTLLTLSIVPLQYSVQTHEVTLYHNLHFEVDYVIGFPAGGPWFENIRINNDQPLRINQEGQTVRVEIGSAESADVDLLWVVRDLAGYVIDSGRSPLAVINGVTTMEFDLDTTGWSPGTKDMAIYIQSGPDYPDSYNAAINVQGIVLSEISQQEHIYPVGVQEAFWHLYVRDENGVLLTGLASNFVVKIDGETVSSTVTQTVSGTYEVQVPIENLDSGEYQVYIQTTDERGITGWQTWQLVRKSSHVYLPFVLRQ